MVQIYILFLWCDTDALDRGLGFGVWGCEWGLSQSPLFPSNWVLGTVYTLFFVFLTSNKKIPKISGEPAKTLI